MDFRPVIRGAPRLMDAAIFRDEPMGLRERMLAIPLARRFTYAADQNIFFINFERLAIRSRAGHRRRCAPRSSGKLRRSGRKVYAIVNYDNFSIAPELVDAWTRDGEGAWSTATTGA